MSHHSTIRTVFPTFTLGNCAQENKLGLITVNELSVVIAIAIIDLQYYK